MTFIPTRKELESLGFEFYQNLIMHHMILRIPDTHTEIMYFDDEKEIVVGIKQCYPESLDDIKTLIRLFSKK